ncbi:hypothetical protein E3N88_28831 [Mikania micrantha]|uniref:Uncharacterized protein n=1 Tax=Mikania micrantha TaxID=192012 RepID=A0A5N6N1T0_9ASTR|nr:hypothetical protein E3N88_28831 [Mikania micrantha]
MVRPRKTLVRPIQGFGDYLGFSHVELQGSLAVGAGFVACGLQGSLQVADLQGSPNHRGFGHHSKGSATVGHEPVAIFAASPPSHEVKPVATIIYLFLHLLDGILNKLYSRDLRVERNVLAPRMLETDQKTPQISREKLEKTSRERGMCG